MSATFTDDDLEKTVENENGEVIGTVTAIEDDVARVEPRAGIVDSIRATLGWGGSGGETLEIHRRSVDEISSESIRLRAESVDALEEPAETDADATTDAAADDSPAGDERGAAGDEPEARDREPIGSTDSSEPIHDAGTTADVADDEPTESAANGESTESAAAPALESDNAAERDPDAESAREPAADRDPAGDADEIPGSDSNAAERDDGFEGTDAVDESTADATVDPNEDDPTAELASDDLPGVGMSGEVGGRDTSDAIDTDEVDLEAESSDAADDPASPDAMSGTRSGDSPGEMDRAGVRDEPMGDTDEVESPDETGAMETERLAAEAEPGDEPAMPEETGLVDESDREPDDGSASRSRADEDPEPADELDPGVDLESAAEPDTDAGNGDTVGSEADADDIAEEFATGTDLEAATESADRSDLEAGTPSGTDEMDLVDELDAGVDLESASDADAEAETASDTRPETELDPDVDGHAAAEDDPRPETEVDAAGSETATVRDQRADPADEFDTGVDIESAVDTDSTGTGTDSTADVDSSPDAKPDLAPSTHADRGAEEAGADAASRERVSERETTVDRRDDGEASRASTPLAAMVAAQRAAMTTGLELVEQGLAVQERAARSAVETSLVAQRQGLEATQAATRSYFDAATALLGGEGGSAPEQQSLDEAIAEVEEAREQSPDDDLGERLESHLAELRALQARFGDDVERSTERAATLLERQSELLEECRQHLDGDGGERTDR